MTYANVASTAALVIAIGGSGVAVAAATLPANSVGSRQIIDNSVKGADVKESSLAKVPLAAKAKGLTNGAIANPGAFGTGDLGIVRGYAWNSSPGASADITNNGYTYNRSGGTVNVVHNGTGDYTINFANLNLGGGNIVVSGYGSSAVWCKVGGWGGSSIDVYCFNSSGTPTDSYWTIAATD